MGIFRDIQGMGGSMWANKLEYVRYVGLYLDM